MGFFWHFYKSDGNHSRPAYIHTPALLQQTKGETHKLKPCMQGLHSPAISELMSWKSVGHLTLVTRVILKVVLLVPVLARCQLKCEARRELLPVLTRPQTTAGDWAAGSMRSLLPSTLPGRTTHIIKFAHSSWCSTWWIIIHISYFYWHFFPSFLRSLSASPSSQECICRVRFFDPIMRWFILQRASKSLSDNTDGGLIGQRLVSPYMLLKKLIKMIVAVN